MQGAAFVTIAISGKVGVIARDLAQRVIYVFGLV